MIDAFLSRFGLRALKIGSPVLSMLESAAQSQLRSSEDIFTLLEASSLDQAKGVALDRIGADEDLDRETESPASGAVTISDTSFSKISSKVFQGTPAPIAGSVKINVIDASLFPSSGSIYIGRGTSNYEGPLAYSSKLAPGTGFGFSGGNYWSLVLSSGTLKFHNLGEVVVLAQGGNRVIGAGSLAQTPQGNVVNAVQFKTLYSATIPDGEVSVEGVTVLALKPGTIGNISDGAINAFVSAPFTGAAVTNPLPFTNGVASESDDSYRERIRQARQSRTRGTALAIETYATGVTAADENKRVLSASVITRVGIGTTLYIDDGTGYEEKSTGVAIEPFIDLATGGEDYFKISAPRPITKAFLLSSEVAPYTLGAGMQLAFVVGGVTTVHTFDIDEFRSIANATAYEVVASVNADPGLLWGARTYANGTQVAIFAKADTNESIQYSAIDPTTGIDANAYFGFSAGRVDTMRLYKNDRLLNKDGSISLITSNAVSSWGALGPTEDLQLQVDGTPLSNLVGGTYTFTAADFINAGTGFNSVSRNTPLAWATVLNYRIPGITAAVVNGRITITSNRGRSSLASLSILGGSLVTKGMFENTLVAVTGTDSDYVLDRNTGEFRLTTALAVDDRLAAGSVNTRAFLETPAFTTIAINSVAHIYVAVDGAAVIIPHGVTASTPITFSKTSPSWGDRERLTVAAGTFSNVQDGDWVVFWDAAAPADIRYKFYRVATVDTAGAWFEIERVAATIPGSPVSFTSGGISFVRTLSPLQRVDIAVDASYTASSFKALLAAALSNATASVYRTTAVRLATTTFSDVNGDIAVVAADIEAQKFGILPDNATKNLTGHLASVESGNEEAGTPDFHQTFITNGPVAFTQPIIDWTVDALFSGPSSSSIFMGLRSMPQNKLLTGTRYAHKDTRSPLTSVSYISGTAYNIYLRKPTLDTTNYEWLDNERGYFASPYRIASADDLTVLVDADTDTKRYVIPMWRTLKTVGSTYGLTSAYKDGDNGGQSLAVGFGYIGNNPFDFNDFAIFMASRAKTHDIGDFSSQLGGNLVNLNKTVLWRYNRLGSEGDWARLKYVLPDAPDQDVAVAVDAYSSQWTDITIRLKSGAVRTGYSLTAADKMGVTSLAPVSGMSKVYYILQYPVATASRSGSTVTLTLTMPSGVTDSGYAPANVYQLTSTHPDFPSGPKTLVSVSGAQSHILTYTEAGAAVSPSNIGSMSVGTTSPSFAGASIAQGDFVHITSNLNVEVSYRPTTFRIVNNVSVQPYWLEASIDNFPANHNGVVQVQSAGIGDATAIKIYQNPAQTVTAIVAAVNALGLASASVPVKGTLIGTGSGTIDRSSAEDKANSNAWYTLSDGLNFVALGTAPGSIAGDYTLQLKDPVNAALATNSDWANEVVRIVPRTTKNVVDWLSSLTVSGLNSAADIETSSAGTKVQIVSATPGSLGSVQIQGGSSNSGLAAVLGSAALAGSTYPIVSIPATDEPGFMGGAWVSVDNTDVLPKVGVITAATALTSIAANGVDANNSDITVSGSTFYTVLTTNNHVLTAVEKQGDFWCFTDSTFGTSLFLTGVAEGDWVRITAGSPAPIYVGVGGNEAVSLINTGNTGIFRVVRVSPSNLGGQSFWIENPSGVAQSLAEANIVFYSAESTMPGDSINISTSAWDNGSNSNKGEFQIVDVGLGFTNPAKITVSAVLSPRGAVAALGSNYRQVQVIEGTPVRAIKKILSIIPNQIDADLLDIKFTTPALYGKIGATPGSVLTLLDKLDFPTSIAKGVDGYQHSTGLIAEVNKVIYGDPGDTTTYPGVAAAGASVNILGPLVKRIQVTLSIRVRTGATIQDIEDRVKSAVASVINKTGIGESIALSDLTNAASKVGGVVSAVMVNPVATAGSDLISVQPYEKPLVLNVDQDVLVSFAGD